MGPLVLIGSWLFVLEDKQPPKMKVIGVHGNLIRIQNRQIIAIGSSHMRDDATWFSTW